MTLYSIGHSNVDIHAFVELLRRYEINALADTRSQPYSRYNLHFSRENLKASVEEAGIEYFYFGKEIGGRPENPALYFPNGKVDYDLVAQSSLYRLITRTLIQRGIEVRHILHSGNAVGSEATEFEPAQPGLF